ncbi:aldose epimerase family protein [Pedobacter psychroterrae]|uniref:Aldose 1-epimerase n=1 Tax=Pedobacter psychroterrae TaxID=2530453 RepID=A0A4R0NB71_9SPHI|nr:aldose epimerase family protein [Pedobacter psychroterrae]TCC96867.1 galactose mutarotase [Pedobacter psychroterrae]
MKYIQAKQENFQAIYKNHSTALYYLKNAAGMEMAVTNFGARVVELWAPDREGNFADIVLGHDHIDHYINFKGERFLGAAIGRFGNRIANGRFSLDGKSYQLPQNDGNNSLHGGFEGFDMVVWKAEQRGNGEITFSYTSQDGEQGFPGNLAISMTYRLTDENEFYISYRATTDQRTIINLTHHSFFNLRGHGNGSINDHQLMINAEYYTPIDNTLIPLGSLDPVAGTPMDFRQPTAIGKALNEKFQQLDYGIGYDHNWVLDHGTGSPKPAATLLEPDSGRYMEVFTTQPGIQFYGGNFFDGKYQGKSGRSYRYRESLALETQHFPDSPNQPAFPSTVLGPGETYAHHCIYRFSVK